MEKINVTAVSYLNTKPFLYGIFQSDIQNEITLSLDIPSVCAQKLRSGEADLGLVPVAVIPTLDNPHIISDYCIGAVGAVKTVCIYSDVPIEAVEHIYLDFHSRTSAALAKLLLKQYWHLNPVFLPSNLPNGANFIEKIGGTTAGLVIGDRTIGLEARFRYVYDLAQVWQDYTEGLPFVFAAWVANKPLSKGFIERFNEALQRGLDLIPQLIYILPQQEAGFSLEEYYTRYISYNLDAAKKQALTRFLSEIELEKDEVKRAIVMQ